MSRSYKHYPFVKDRASCKVGKKLASARVRVYIKRGGEIANGNAYKKLYQSWDICDYCWSETWQQYQDWFNNGCSRRNAEEPNYYDWYKAYKAK